jgi:hypothetical protein
MNWLMAFPSRKRITKTKTTRFDTGSLKESGERDQPTIESINPLRTELNVLLCVVFTGSVRTAQ